MNFLHIFLLSFFLLNLIQVESFDIQNSSNSTNTTHHTKRLIKIHSVQADFISYDPLKKEKTKFDLIPLSENNTGVIYIDVKQRGFKFTFRQKQGIEIKSDGVHQPGELLEKIFKELIGQYNMTDANTLSSLRLYQPIKNEAPFEFSQLKNQCWRVDVYPEPETNCDPGACIIYSMNLKFCVKKYNDHLIVRNYGYILEAKELDHTNKE